MLDYAAITLSEALWNFKFLSVIYPCNGDELGVEISVEIAE